MYIQGKIKKIEDGIQDVLFIRDKVFGEELKIPLMAAEDNEDKDAYFAVIYMNIASQLGEANKTKEVATGRLILDELGRYKIGRIAVLPEKRGKQYGDMVVKMLIHKAFDLGGKEVYVASQINAIEFYKKIGFICCNQKIMEHGVEHELMVLEEKSLTKKCQI